MNKPASRYKVVIYDCDGVMLDSLESNYVFYNRVLSSVGCPPIDRSDSVTRTVLHTHSFNDVMDYFFINDKRRNDAMAFAKTIHYRDLAPYMRVEEGFVQTLDRLREYVSLAICTNRASSMDMIIEDLGLNGYFSCVMTASQVRYPKPHPEPLLKVLAHFGITAGEAVFVGDAEVDMQAAAAAGVPFVAYKSDLPVPVRIGHHGEIVNYLF